MDFESFLYTYQKKEVEHFKNRVGPNPLVSICVQTYLHENFIEECLNNILCQQTTFDFEILLGEDCSNDKTRQICISYAEKYPEKIRLFLHRPENKISVNGALTGNFNFFYNFFSARGRYIAVCEGDDFWGDPLKLQKQFDFMENYPSYSICYHGFKIVDEHSKVIESKKAFSIKKDLTATELMHPISHPGTLTIFFRNALEKVPEEAVKVVTLDIFIYSLLGQHGNGKYLSEIKPAFYRTHSSGMWSAIDLDKKLTLKIISYKMISSYYRRIGLNKSSRFFDKIIFKTKGYLIYWHLKNFRFKKIIPLLKD
jgi:glycosyltransferase involved in cell wall biosynthesis